MISKVSTFLGPNGLFQGGSGTPSLVLSLDTNNVLSYGGTSSTWYDLSIRKNNGLLNNVISITGSIPNTSLSFNGTGSYISFTQSSGIPLGTASYTIEAWFNSDSYDSIGTLIGWGTEGATNQTNVLRLNGNGLNNYWWFNDLNVTFTGTQSMIVGNWYYVTATYDGTDRKIYLNGELKSSDTPTAPNVTNSSTLKIGHFYDDEYFDGRISKIKVSDKALAASKILSNFNADKIRHGYVFGSMTFNDTQNGYLISSSSDYAFGTSDFTVEAFFKTVATASYSFAGIVSLRGNGIYTNGVDINLQYVDPSTPLIEFSANGNFLTYTASNDEWYHVAISRKGGTSSFFVNGNLFNQVADNLNYGNNDLVVGRYYTNLDDYYFNGMISNVRVLNGTSLYTGTFSVPSVQLSYTHSNTKLLITSQQTTPSADISGLLHSVTASNIGWTSSLPSFYEFYYPDFSDITGLELVHTIGVSANAIRLTDLTPAYAANVYRSEAIRFDRSFSFEWVFECSGGYGGSSGGADGFCVQWTTTNNTYGNQGGDVGIIANSSTINAVKFLNWDNNCVIWYQNNNQVISENNSIYFRPTVYYWMDYNYSTSTMYIYYSTTNTKPGSPQHTFTSFTFDGGNYYIGFGAATGGSVDNHILKSMKLTFL
jgi:hypothetical protein